MNRALTVVLAVTLTTVVACSSSEDQPCGTAQSYEGAGCLPPEPGPTGDDEEL